MATLASAAQWCSPILFPERASLVADLLERCDVMNRSRPKRGASRYLVDELASEADVEVGRGPCPVVLLLISSVVEEVVLLPL